MGIQNPVYVQAVTPLNPAAPASVTVTGTSATIVNANVARTGLVLVNTSTDTISLAFGTNAAVAGKGITLATTQSFKMDGATFTTQSVQAISSGTSSPCAIQEFS